MPFTLEKCGFKRREAVIVFEKQCSKGFSYGIFEQLPAEHLYVVHRLLVNDNDRIKKKILFPGKKFVIHLRKFVHVFVGGGYELHVIHQSVALQFSGKLSITRSIGFCRTGGIRPIFSLPDNPFPERAGKPGKSAFSRQCQSNAVWMKIVHDRSFGLMHGCRHIAK